MKRSIYLKKTDWQEALRLFRQVFKDIFPLEEEVVDARNAYHRITSEQVVAKLASPAYDAAAMDGIAVKAEMTFGATPSKPVRLEPHKSFVFVDTGAPIEQPFDAVIKVEEIVEVDDTVEISHPVPPGKDVRSEGEDFASGERILPAHHCIRPVDIGAMLSCGVLSVKVIRRPRVGILPTGSEIVEPGERIEPGNIIDCNSYIAEQLVCEWGGESHRMAIVRNEKSLLMRKIAEAVKAHDIVVVIAGTSAGSEDLSLPVLKEMGEVLVHGVDLMPGKPAILGRIDDTPVIGLPGYPVSAYVVLDIFVREAVAMALGTEPAKKATTSAVLEGGIPSKLGMDEIVRIKLRRRNGTLYAIPLKRGAGVLKSVVEADGFIHIPKNEEGLIAGSQVTVELITDNF